MKRIRCCVEEHLAGLLLAAVTLLIVAQLVLARAAPRLASPLTPVVLALFFWATLLGVPAATRRDAHLGITLLSRWLPTRWCRVLRLAGLIAALAFFVTLTITGFRQCCDPAIRDNRFLGTWCPEWVVTACVPLAAALSCLRAVEACRARLRGPADGGDAAADKVSEKE